MLPIRPPFLQMMDDFVSCESRRLSARVRRAERREESARFDSWAAAAATDLVLGLRQTALARACEFEVGTGQCVLVGDQLPNAMSLTGPWISSVCLSLRASRVFLYSSRVSGCAPYVHLLSLVPGPPGRHERLLSLPGARIFRGPDDGLRLEFLDADPDGRAGDVMPTDLLVVRAFARLVADDERSQNECLRLS
ncbi:MAG: hypothetical protein HRU17_09875 [Polyangiaceae bacterium]|nr:hypothetical protein [Polyangiaceae bacterium]